MDGSLLFLLFSRYSNNRQGLTVAFYEAIQLQTERLGIEPVSFYSTVLFIQLLRADHLTLDPQGSELPLQPKTKPARFVNSVHFSSLLLEFGRPGHKRFFPETLRRPRISS